MPPRHLFIASLGNPPPYSSTLHSAGHVLLGHLSSLPHPNPHWTLYKSRTLMNGSGPPIISAYTRWLSRLPTSLDRTEARLVVLHDELESPLGKVKLRVGGSVKGHNGLRSLIQAGGEKMGMVRVGVGIGRPESRERGDVSQWVLRGMTRREREVLGGEGVGEEVIKLLEGI